MAGGSWRAIAKAHGSLTRAGSRFPALLTKKCFSRTRPAIGTSKQFGAVIPADAFCWMHRTTRTVIDYETITHDIEAAVPATHREEPNLTRSGIETLEWISSSELRLHITYNNTSVVVVADVAEPSSPKFHVLPHNET
jgi:hypothetical protein